MNASMRIASGCPAPSSSSEASPARLPASGGPGAAVPGSAGTVFSPSGRFDLTALAAAAARHRGNALAVAEELGLEATAVRRQMRRLGLPRQGWHNHRGYGNGRDYAGIIAGIRAGKAAKVVARECGVPREVVSTVRGVLRSQGEDV